MYGLHQVQDPSKKALQGMESSGDIMANQKFMQKEEKTAGGGLMAAGSGAAMGASVGSVIPGVGTAVGAVAGTVISTLGYFLS